MSMWVAGGTPSVGDRTRPRAPREVNAIQVFDQLVAFPSSVLSARRARQLVRRMVAPYMSAPTLDTIELLTSEVVTNAVVHAGSSPIVEVTAEGGTVRISVQDQNPTWPMPREVPEDATSGRGMVLVDAMADAWGVERIADDGKRIWFEVRGE